VLSRLPALRGNYPLTPTLGLRLVNLLTDSGYAPSATNAVNDLLKLDSITVGSDISRDQTLFNLRFSIEYLIRARTLDSAGAALHPWYNFAAFLYSNEPANFALLSLFRSGYIHKICDLTQPNYNIIDAKRNLMHVLSFLFCRQYISKTNFDKELFAQNNRTPSKVILPELDAEVYKILREHNDEVLTVFTECATTYAIQHGESLGTDNVLPLSGRTIEAISSRTSSPFVQSLKASRIPVRSRSAFVATSGHGDVYDDVDELVRTARSGVHLTKHILPSLDSLESDDINAGRYINAYLYDFYVHGQDKPLSDANGIAKGQVWYLLLDFSYAMDGMVVAIRELLLKDTRRLDDDMTSAAGESVAVIQDDWAAENDEVDKDEAIAAAGPNVGGPVEKEKGDDVQAIVATSTLDVELVKPDHVSQLDWDVYTAFFQLQKDFNEKFKAMWA
jgi:ATP-dependent RNA helicase DDX60